MRCQKCGFISFDQLTSCVKCGVDLAAKPPEYVGTGQKTEPPFFLAAALGEAVAQESPAVEAEAEAVEEVQSGTAALFDELEAESQGLVAEEEGGEFDLSGAELEEDQGISLVLPAEEEPAALEITEEIEVPEEAQVAPEEESLEISLEMPEEEAEVAEAGAAEEISLELPGEDEPAIEVAEEAEVSVEEVAVPEEEGLELTLEGAETEALVLEVAEEGPEAPAADQGEPEAESLELSLEMPEAEEEAVAAVPQEPEAVSELGEASSAVDLESIDLSDLVGDSGAKSAPESSGEDEEIFDLSALIGDDGESDELVLESVDDGEKSGKKEDSGLSLELED